MRCGIPLRQDFVFKTVWYTAGRPGNGYNHGWVDNRLHIRIPNDIADAWSWDEFLEICSVIRSKTDIQYPLLMDTGRGLTSKQGEWISYSTLPFIIQNNGGIFDEKLSHTNGYLNSPPTIDAITWLGDLFHRYRYTHMEDLHHLFPDHFAMSLSLPSAFFALAPE